MYRVEDITNLDGVIINNKIEYCKIFKLGNIVTGWFMIKNGSVFSYSEKLITFPFDAKSEMREYTFEGNYNFYYTIYKRQNSIRYLVPNGYVINNAMGNFMFFI